jgi:uncharacterized protein
VPVIVTLGTAMPDKRRPTLIVFAREPIPHHSKTRLIPAIGANSAATLTDAFLRDALRKARSVRPSKLVLAADAPGGAKRSEYFRSLARELGAELVDQGEGTLGARMRRALASDAASGAVLIGTDTPSLPMRLLKRNVDLLRDAPVVLGPSLDGGYYLIGVRGAIPDIFRGIRWGSSRVLAQTVARLRRLRVEYRLGPTWYDVDRKDDLSLLALHLALMLKDRGHAVEANPCPATSVVLYKLGLLDRPR